MKTQRLRDEFFAFYEKKGHKRVAGASTIPSGDATILFTIAGMTPFKDIFSGKAPAPHPRLTNVQKCVRAADLEDVGLDGRHLTFFEMLGLWSFGDYGKKESIAWAWEFITTVLKLDTERIWATVHTSDEESIGFWKAVGLPADRIVALGDDDNFWAMGPTGPCGPCSEIYFDQGPEVGCKAQGKGICNGPGCDCDRYLEFWNNVFMEFNRKPDGSLEPLPQKNIDTGVGLERLAALCQKQTSAYGTDAFLGLGQSVCDTLGVQSPLSELSTSDRQCVQVISDHLRTLTITLADGAGFSNEGRGYVLRRILRRAVRYSHRLRESQGQNPTVALLHKLPAAVCQALGDFYSELRSEIQRVSQLIHDEEQRFLKTLETGLAHFNERAAPLKEGDAFPGEEIFVLHDTFGFPSDLTALLCRERGLQADEAGFEKAMEQQKQRSRESSQFYAGTDLGDFQSVTSPLAGAGHIDSVFCGYHLTSDQSAHEWATAEAALPNPLDHVSQAAGAGTAQLFRTHAESQHLDVIFSASPFYPEGGGQVADEGWIVFGDRGSATAAVFEVVAVRKVPEGIAHTLRPHPSKGQNQPAEVGNPDGLRHTLSQPLVFLVNQRLRRLTAKNHSATHLLHAALRKVLGEHVRQAGSHVDASGLRFDFSHPQALTADERAQIEDTVFSCVEAALSVETLADVPIAEAKQMGALAMFGEKYGETVRVLRMGEGVSVELCGGTHVTNTAEIGDFRILSEGSVTSGVRRIEARTGRGLREWSLSREKHLEAAAATLRTTPAEPTARIEQLKESEKSANRRAEDLQKKLAGQASQDLASDATEVAPGVKLCTHNLGTLENPKELENLGDTLKQKTQGVVVLGAVFKDKPQLMVLVHPQVRQTHKGIAAGSIIKNIASHIEGRGGGKPEFARAGGQLVDGVDAALQNAAEVVRTLAQEN